MTTSVLRYLLLLASSLRRMGYKLMLQLMLWSLMLMLRLVLLVLRMLMLPRSEGIRVSDLTL